MRFIRTSLSIWVVSVCALACLARARADTAALSEALEAQVNALDAHGAQLRGLRIAWPELIQRFYSQRGFQPIWNRESVVQDLLRAIRASYDDGLEPEDYFLTPLSTLARELAGDQVGDTARAELDVLCTEALLRLGYHLAFGRVDPAQFDPHWNYGATLPAETAIIAKVEQVVAGGDLFGRIEALKPTHLLYVGLKRELARYRGIAAKGGLQPITAAPTLKLGAVDARVARLRARLQASGDAAPAAGDPNLFDDALAAALRDYQARVGLTATGSVDARTLAELNVPIAARIEQMRVNLDRGRVLLRDLPEDFVVINVAGFEASLVRQGQVRWRARVQVGRPLRRTPIFRSELSYVVFNPTWTVPPSILTQDILPKGAKGVASHHLKVYDRTGRELDPKQIRWSKYRKGNVPFVLRQDAGPHNALGRVKLMFPNAYSVYLHDTPAQELFEAGDRSFSSGCVRVERALELAQWVLNDPTKWGAAQIEQLIAERRTQNVALPQKLPVLLAYWTAWVDDKQRLNFRRDVYHRDAVWSEQLSNGFVPPKLSLLAQTHGAATTPR